MKLRFRNKFCPLCQINGKKRLAVIFPMFGLMTGYCRKHGELCMKYTYSGNPKYLVDGAL